MRSTSKRLIFVALCSHLPLAGTASASTGDRAEIVTQLGLIQPLLLHGGNIELDLFVKRFVVGYSHGFKLTLEDETVVGDAKRQGLAFDLPFSTGLSVGYRLRDWLDVRGEAKWHRFKVRYDETRVANASGELFSYDTFTLGAGVYAHWRPWRDKESWLKGWNVSTSVRYWPNIATTLDGDKREYDNQYLDEKATHEANNIGIANTPWLFNVSVGYRFALNYKGTTTTR